MIEEKKIFVGNCALQKNTKPVNGEIVLIENERYYKISNYDLMSPFLMNIVSDSDLWMFISSNGALTAGRKNPDQALFPYYTDDRIHDSQDITGNKIVIFITQDDKLNLWEPFSSSYNGLYNTERTIYKNLAGNKLIFEEVNFDLSISYQYSWLNCERFGFIKKSKIINMNHNSIYINVLDGIQNLLPYGTDRKFQLEYSTLLDAYKKNELIEEIGLGLYTLSSIPTDKAEPNEALKTTTVWSFGLNNTNILLSSKQSTSFEQGNSVVQENIIKAMRGAYLIQSEFELLKNDKIEWYIIADVDKNQSEIVALSSLLSSEEDLKGCIENEIFKSTEHLNRKIANADGFQLTNDRLNIFRHFSNVTFNIMRGGVFENNYLIEKSDFSLFLKTANSPLWNKHITFLDGLTDIINFSELINQVEKLNKMDFLKLCYEYLPLTFSRRHGDPSRPWNHFSIDIKDKSGKKSLNYQGNWRDIFQNWEALAYSFPSYIENMIVKFVNASTADGYNPYRITREGYEWEEFDPSDTWSYIGYWGDHQIIYLLKLLELSSQYHPKVLESFLGKEMFAYANIPYKIKSYEKIIEDPHNTIEFDLELDKRIKKKVEEIGYDGKYIMSDNKKIYHINLSEKLLVPVLVKFSNFIPGAGIWMNTQRPEWNDANNALVGFGASLVTLYYLRRFIAFNIKLFKKSREEQIWLSDVVFELFLEINQTMIKFQNLLKNEITDCNRKRILDKLGKAGSTHRQTIYAQGFNGKKKLLSVSQLLLFFDLALDYLDHSIRSNKRNDDLFHSYNLIKFNDQNEISIRNLYEMLEGQVAILSSGYLSFEDAIVLLRSLRTSNLYRKDQDSYILYPERDLTQFIEKNKISEELLTQSKFLQSMISRNDKSIVDKDINGDVHFNSKFRNSSVLKKVLGEHIKTDGLSLEEKQVILNIYESVFDHQSFTGRSCTFYKYEGLGSIYWHMVSKLLLAVQEIYFKAVQENIDISIRETLKKYYYEILNGIGSHKKPELYGAFPTDPYSHTPANMGVQQPGMTGQVKEDIISRFTELGFFVRDGQIHFNFSLLNKNEFLTKSQVYNYIDVNGVFQSLMLNSGMLAYTICQVPIIYILSEYQGIILARKDGIEEKIAGHFLDTTLSRIIFQRKGEVIKIKVLINKLNS